ncbi:AI-2E family transporter [Lacticaseibacillus daqingensis]|uniref:AI-2E family transporter n=1 Tax=Lacticaseibacillus daqingensis TaxID=2486014 RepID=UPI000F7B1584|nr:AI-2E family transporter [Lacticaseibacillus daqingensis]
MTNKHTWFYRHFLDNKFAIAGFNVLMALLIIWVFTKIAWVFQPVANFLGIVAPPFVFAGVLFYLLNPIVTWLVRRGLHRNLAIAIVFIGLVGVLAAAILKLVPSIERQVTSLINYWPDYWAAFSKWLTDLNANQDLIAQKDLNQLGSEIMSALSGKEGLIVSGTVAQIQNLVGMVGNVVVTVGTAPIILFFMLKDGDKFTPLILQVVPNKLRASMTQMLHEMNEKVGSYVQGQITVAIAVGIIFMVGYSLIGLKFALVLGLIAAPLNLIPYFGSALAMVPALIVGLMTSPKMFIMVIVVFFVEWLLETQLISPFVMGSKLEMHPITIVVVLLTAGNMFGLVGVILGIPGFAVLRIVVVRLFRWYQQVSGLYEDPQPEPSAPLPAPAQPDKKA